MQVSELKLCFGSTMSRMMYVTLVVVGVTLLLTMSVEGEPLPAPNLDKCHSRENCCLPPYEGKIKKFEFDPNLPMRTRRAAQGVDKEYVAKLEKAYELLEALPHSDPRSFRNLANFHCLYCDNGLTYDNVTSPLEIHNHWLFLPWHRLLLYFHERTLAKLLGDDTFALPFWNWDNQTPVPPYGNTLPHIYARKNSSLYDVRRNPCIQPPHLVDLNSGGGCRTITPANELRVKNNRLMYTQVVTGSVTPRLFFGAPYHLGDAGGGGPGTIEADPHGQIHLMTGNLMLPGVADMGNFGSAARDPVFYAHHANLDRLWTVWKTLPGGNRNDFTDKDWLDSEIVYYDENGDRVVAKVSQALDPRLLRYNYESIHNPWVTNGVSAGLEHHIPLCFPVSRTETEAMIKSTPPLSSAQVLHASPFSFRVLRPPPMKTGYEVLVLEGISMNFSLFSNVDAYLFHPTANISTSVGCPEFFGTFNNVPHFGQALVIPKREWRFAIGEKLKILGKEYVSHIVVSFAQTVLPAVPVTFQSAKIIYETE